MGQIRIHHSQIRGNESASDGQLPVCLWTRDRSDHGGCDLVSHWSERNSRIDVLQSETQEASPIAEGRLWRRTNMQVASEGSSNPRLASPKLDRIGGSRNGDEMLARGIDEGGDLSRSIWKLDP